MLKFAFQLSGNEINDCMMIADDHSLFLSCGESFISPSSLEATKSTSEEYASEKNNIPSNVGMYSVGALLGRGGFGFVRLGTNRLTKDKVALKFLRKSDILSVGAAERTSTEIQCLNSLEHESIIRLHKVSEIYY